MAFIIAFMAQVVAWIAQIARTLRSNVPGNLGFNLCHAGDNPGDLAQPGSDPGIPGKDRDRWGHDQAS